MTLDAELMSRHSLAAVNFFLFCTGATQCARILNYQASLKNESVAAAAKDAVVEEGHLIKEMAQDVAAGKPEKAVKMS